MKRIKNQFSWLRSFRYLRMSLSLLIIFILFVVVNGSFFVLAQTPQNAQAQDVPTTTISKKTAEETQSAETAPSTSTAQTAPTPKPAAKPAAAPAPKPSYDKVSIPSIGLSSKFVTVGLTNTNAIDVPASSIGWWNGSSVPGTPGAVFLDGHNPGVFSKLPNIQVGAQIVLIQASGETFTYTVVFRETVELAGINMYKALSTYDGSSEGLNLMTCVGTYNPNTGTTDQRLVVYAVRS